MKNMRCTLFLRLFWIVVGRVDDLTEKPLLLFSEESPIPMELVITYNTVNIMIESEHGSMAALDGQCRHVEPRCFFIREGNCTN